jgi:hypothetical protein
VFSQRPAVESDCYFSLHWSPGILKARMVGLTLACCSDPIIQCNLVTSQDDEIQRSSCTWHLHGPVSLFGLQGGLAHSLEFL